MKIKCLICDSTIKSKYTYNLVTCKCYNMLYRRRKRIFTFWRKDFNKILIIFDDGTEILASDEINYRKKYEEWENKRY